MEMMGKVHEEEGLRVAISAPDAEGRVHALTFLEAERIVRAQVRGQYGGVIREHRIDERTSRLMTNFDVKTTLEDLWRTTRSLLPEVGEFGLLKGPTKFPLSSS